MNQKLRHCYDQIHQILGKDIEPYESVELVDRYRQYWKPMSKIRVILLAESHVFTSDDDRKIKIPHIPNLPGYETQYAKFVYCLGYGERLLTGNSSHPKRDGTPQFWKILYSCNNRIQDKNDFHPVLSRTQYEQRVKNKINLLLRLQQNGIWLVDSSIVALYNNREKPNKSIISSVIRKSWDYYTHSIVAEAEPDYVIFVGKTVAHVLKHDIENLVGNRYTVLCQPNAHLLSEEHMANFRQYSRICC